MLYFWKRLHLERFALSGESVFTFIDAFMRKANLILAKEKHSLQTRESTVGSERSAALLCKSSSKKDNHFLWRGYFAFWKLS